MSAFVEDKYAMTLKFNDTTVGHENLFRLIFETQIQIHIHIRYFKSLPIETYYLTTIHIKNLYLH